MNTEVAEIEQQVGLDWIRVRLDNTVRSLPAGPLGPQAEDGSQGAGVPEEAERRRSGRQIPLPASLQALLPQAASLPGL